ncbi:hypothetical protein ACLB2K_019424 [Fragaria x ananassa]
MESVRELATEKAAVIFTKSSCCICHSVKSLFYELGASPAIHEIDRYSNGRDMESALRQLGCNPSFPAVFIGGKYVGSSKDIISLHVDGSLKQMLKDARAIWLSLWLWPSDETFLYRIKLVKMDKEIGVRASVNEIDNDPDGREMEKYLMRMGCSSVPAVFIGGQLIGSTNEVMSLHLKGQLIPKLKAYEQKATS